MSTLTSQPQFSVCMACFATVPNSQLVDGRCFQCVSNETSPQTLSDPLDEFLSEQYGETDTNQYHIVEFNDEVEAMRLYRAPPAKPKANRYLSAKKTTPKSGKLGLKLYRHNPLNDALAERHTKNEAKAKAAGKEAPKPKSKPLRADIFVHQTVIRGMEQQPRDESLLYIGILNRNDNTFKTVSDTLKPLENGYSSVVMSSTNGNSSLLHQHLDILQRYASRLAADAGYNDTEIEDKLKKYHRDAFQEIIEMDTRRSINSMNQSDFINPRSTYQPYMNRETILQNLQNAGPADFQTTGDSESEKEKIEKKVAIYMAFLGSTLTHTPAQPPPAPGNTPTPAQPPPAPGGNPTQSTENLFPPEQTSSPSEGSSSSSSSSKIEGYTGILGTSTASSTSTSLTSRTAAGPGGSTGTTSRSE